LTGQFDPRRLPDTDLEYQGKTYPKETDFTREERKDAISNDTLDKICGIKGEGKDLVRCVVNELKFCRMDYTCDSNQSITSGKEVYTVDANVQTSAICASDHPMYGGCSMHPLDCLKDSTYHQLYYGHFREQAKSDQSRDKKMKLETKQISTPR